MAENVKAELDTDKGEVMAMRSLLVVEAGAPGRVAGCNEKSFKNSPTISCNDGDGSQQKDQELPELIRHKEVNKVMPCLPYINLSELTTILRDPSMPSKKILNEVADKIMLRSEESESDDGSVSSGGGVVGMKGLLDCIFEVSYLHEDSASSDSESDDDGSFQRFSREIPCKFCDKIFGSTMTWNTHVLVAHAQQDSSVQNIKRFSSNEADHKDKSHPQRKYTRCTTKSESDVRDINVLQTSAAERKHGISSPHNENAPVRKRHSSFSKSQPKEHGASKTYNKHHFSVCQKKKESPSKEEIGYKLAAEDEGVNTASVVSENTSNHTLVKTEHCTDYPVEKKCKESLSGIEVSHEINTMNLDQCGPERPDDTENKSFGTLVSAFDVSANALTSNTHLNENIKSGRKRKSTSPLPESSLSSSVSSNSKCSKKA